MHQPLRLTCSRHALVANWRWLAQRAGTATGAAIKADGYGLGAGEVFSTLRRAGCRDFFVSTWWEAAELGATEGISLAVLHGVGIADTIRELQPGVRPVLNSPAQVMLWKQIAPDQPCDAMIDTGMNRLGLRPDELALLNGLQIDTLHSHLACADEDHLLNEQQLTRFREVVGTVEASRYSLANSAAILLGSDFAFDLVRPGLALYGGIPRAEARGYIQQVVHLEAQVVQRRLIRAGESCGYNATFQAKHDTQAAVLNIGYADGYWRGFSARGSANAKGATLPVLGLVSMDLVTVACDDLPELAEGDWVTIDFELETASRLSGKSQYELITGLGHRFERVWH
jgi:alanine racemase